MYLCVLGRVANGTEQNVFKLVVGNDRRVTRCKDTIRNTFFLILKIKQFLEIVQHSSSRRVSSKSTNQIFYFF